MENGKALKKGAENRKNPSLKKKNETNVRQVRAGQPKAALAAASTAPAPGSSADGFEGIFGWYVWIRVDPFRWTGRRKIVDGGSRSETAGRVAGGVGFDVEYLDSVPARQNHRDRPRGRPK